MSYVLQYVVRNKEEIFRSENIIEVFDFLKELQRSVIVILDKWTLYYEHGKYEPLMCGKGSFINPHWYRPEKVQEQAVSNNLDKFSLLKAEAKRILQNFYKKNGIAEVGLNQFNRLSKNQISQLYKQCNMNLSDFYLNRLKGQSDETFQNNFIERYAYENIGERV